MKKLTEGLQFYRDKLHEPAVFQKFQEILAKARANKSANKPDVELNEFEAVSYSFNWFGIPRRVNARCPCSSLNSIRHRARMTSLWRRVWERRRLRQRNEPRNGVSVSSLVPFRVVVSLAHQHKQRGGKKSHQNRSQNQSLPNTGRRTMGNHFMLQSDYSARPSSLCLTEAVPL